LYALNRGILLTPFYNMALMSLAKADGDVDHHTAVFAEMARKLAAHRARKGPDATLRLPACPEHVRRGRDRLRARLPCASRGGNPSRPNDPCGLLDGQGARSAGSGLLPVRLRLRPPGDLHRRIQSIPTMAAYRLCPLRDRHVHRV